MKKKESDDEKYLCIDDLEQCIGFRLSSGLVCCENCKHYSIEGDHSGLCSRKIKEIPRSGKGHEFWVGCDWVCDYHEPKPKWNKLQEIRRSSGLTREAFATALGVSLDTLKSYECGRLQCPEERADRARRIPAAVKSAISSLLTTLKPLR